MLDMNMGRLSPFSAEEEKAEAENDQNGWHGKSLADSTAALTESKLTLLALIQLS